MDKSRKVRELVKKNPARRHLVTASLYDCPVIDGGGHGGSVYASSCVSRFQEVNAGAATDLGGRKAKEDLSCPLALSPPARRSQADHVGGDASGEDVKNKQPLRPGGAVCTVSQLLAKCDKVSALF